MSLDPTGRRQPRRAPVSRGALGQTYGYAGRAPYGPTAPAGWTGPPVATGHGTQRPGAAVALGGLRRQPLGYAQLPYGAAPVTRAHLGRAPTSTGTRVAGGAASAGVTFATTAVATAGGVSAVPVAGWVIAGGLIASAGIVLLVDTFRKKGKRAAREKALAAGWPMDFANAYARYATGSLKAAERAKGRLSRKVQKEKADEKKAKARLAKKPGSKSRKNKLARAKEKVGKAVDQYNAANVVVNLKKTTPSEALIAGQMSSVPAEADSKGPIGDAVWELTTGDTGKLVLGGTAIALLAYAGTSMIGGR